ERGRALRLRGALRRVGSLWRCDVLQRAGTLLLRRVLQRAGTLRLRGGLQRSGQIGHLWLRSGGYAFDARDPFASGRNQFTAVVDGVFERIEAAHEESRHAKRVILR